MECGCPEPESCGLRVVWKQARDAVAAILDGTTFADIRAQHVALKAGQAGLIDSILNV